MEEENFYDKLITLPKQIISIAEENKNKVSLLTKSYCENFDIKEIKQFLTKLFERYNNEKYNFLVLNPLSSNSFEITGVLSRNNSSKIEKIIDDKIDSQKWLSFFYNSLLQMIHALTIEEVTYLVNYFFYSKTEEEVLEEIGISYFSFKKVKNSCLIKLYLLFNNL